MNIPDHRHGLWQRWCHLVPDRASWLVFARKRNRRCCRGTTCQRTPSSSRLPAFRTCADTSSRAADEMLVATPGSSTLPALGQHHVRLLLSQRSILKVIHAFPYPVICTTAGRMHSGFTARNIEAAESRPNRFWLRRTSG